MMKPPFKFLARSLSNISVISGQWVSWLTVAMVILLTANILSSWLFKQSAILVTESVTWMHSANFLLAAAYTLNRDEHVRVDIFYSRMSVRGRTWVNLTGSLLLLIPVSVFILWSSWSYVKLSWKIGEVSAESGGMPATFILKGFLIVMPLLLLFEAVNQVYINISQLQSDSQIKNKKGRI